VNVLVILALGVMVLSFGAAIVAMVALKRAVSGLTAAGRSASERLEPLRSELADEQAVTELELAALQRTMEAGRPARRRG
jgi:hypothetical protein